MKTSTPAAYTVIFADSEIELASAYDAVTRALHENALGNVANVVGPNGWILLNGRMVGGEGDWMVLEVGYDAGRGQAVVRGVNLCTPTLEPFSWSFGRRGSNDSRSTLERYSFKTARVLDQRGMALLAA